MLKYYYNKGQNVNGLLIVEQISIPTKKGKSAVVMGNEKQQVKCNGNISNDKER